MTLLPGRRFALATLGLVLGGLLVAAAVWAAGFGPRSQDGTPLDPAQVVLVGVTGLSWDDVVPETMPTLSDLQSSGASAALVVRGAELVTCPADGWLTLSAGQRAAAVEPGRERTGCPEPAGVPDAATGPVDLPSWPAWQAASASQGLGTRLGSLGAALAEAGQCVTAHGPLAALGAADPDGRVERYSPERDPWSPGAGGGSCALALVDGGTVSGPEGAAALDAELTALVEELPEDATLVVAGLADPTARPGLRVLVVHGQGAGALTAPGTRQPGVLQTADLTATVLTLAGAEVPPSVGGQPARLLPEEVPASAQQVRDTARAGTLVQALAGPFLTVTVLLGLVALVLARLVSRRMTAVVATVAMAVPAATFLAGLVPWWRVVRSDADGGGLWLAGGSLGVAVLAFAGVMALLAWAGPWRRAVTGPPAVVAALSLLVIGVDVIWGGRLGLVGILGVQPATGGRFYGMGNVALGIVAAATILLAGTVAAVLAHRRVAAAGAVLALGTAAALVDGVPQWGADFGGVPAVLVATGVLALAAAGVRPTVGRLVLVGVGALAAAALLMVLDWLRPPGERTHLGGFVQSVVDGAAWDVVVRKLEQSVGILVRFPVSWVAVVLLAVLAWGLAVPSSPPGRVLAPLWRVPLLRTTCGALLAGLVVGWLLNDSGVAIVGLGLAVSVAALVAVRMGLPDVPGGPSQPDGPEPPTRAAPVWGSQPLP